jgi:hypothetical protein
MTKKASTSSEDFFTKNYRLLGAGFVAELVVNNAELTVE